jgi:hypothetical protein
METFAPTSGRKRCSTIRAARSTHAEHTVSCYRTIVDSAGHQTQNHSFLPIVADGFRSPTIPAFYEVLNANVFDPEGPEAPRTVTGNVQGSTAKSHRRRDASRRANSVSVLYQNADAQRI